MWRGHTFLGGLGDEQTFTMFDTTTQTFKLTALEDLDLI